jgi:AcrR family transcriptional regulator
MITKNQSAVVLPPPRGRGRPPGITEQGTAARAALYKTALELIAEKGYEPTTLRDIAQRAGVSVGLLYRYFPSKQSLVLHLYDELTAEYAERARQMPSGKWRDRFFFALATSLDVLRPHRSTLSALTSILVGDSHEGLFAPSTSFSRVRVQGVFAEAVTGATDAPHGDTAAALGRLLYVAHLAVILWWLLDKSRGQRATFVLLGLIRQALPASALLIRVPLPRNFILQVDRVFQEALFSDAAPNPSQ